MRLLAGSVVAVLTACAPAQDDPIEPQPEGTDNSACDIGFDPGDCPPDFTLPSTDGGSVTLSEQGAQRVIVIGSSIW